MSDRDIKIGNAHYQVKNALYKYQYSIPDLEVYSPISTLENLIFEIELLRNRIIELESKLQEK